MRHLFTIDTHDYDPCGSVEVRPSVRGIILRDGKVLMVYSRKYDYYKFPGGGIEPGEGMDQALSREVREETGFAVAPGSIREYGLVHRRSRGETTDLFVQDNYYYLCDVTRNMGQRLDDYEADEGFTPEFVTPEQAIETNRFHDHGGKWSIVQLRDSRVLELLVAEGFFGAKKEEFF